MHGARQGAGMGRGQRRQLKGRSDRCENTVRGALTLKGCLLVCCMLGDRGCQARVRREGVRGIYCSEKLLPRYSFLFRSPYLTYSLSHKDEKQRVFLPFLTITSKEL